MYLGSSSSRPQSARSGMGERASIHRRLVWSITLALGGLAAIGVVVVAQTTVPNWHGTEPASISRNLPVLSWQPVIASDLSSELMVITWSNPPSEGAPRNIYTVHSTDNGRSWTNPTEISTTASDSLKPDLVIVEGQIFVAWAEDVNPPTAIYEAERTLSTSWETREIPGSHSLDGFTRPHLATSAGRLHVVFSDSESNILYAARPVTATTWLTATAVYTHTTSDKKSRYPVLAVAPDGQTLHLVWQENTFSINENVIMYMRGQVNGDSVVWDPADIISSQGQDMVEPDVAADSRGDVHVTWGEVGAGGREEQYIRYTHYSGGSWMTPTLRIDPNPVRVHDQSPYFVAPEMALWETDDQMTLCVTWHGYQVDAVIEGAVEEALLSCSQDRGDSWSLPQNVSRSSADNWVLSINPSIAFNMAGQLQVVWQERAGDIIAQDYEIYHSRALDQIFLPIIMRNG